MPRISRLMALAIHCDQLIRDGVVRDQTELAKRLKISQPRMTQLMNLTHLAVDIQEALLFLPRTTAGRDPIHEKLLRPIAAEVEWAEQRGLWERLRLVPSWSESGTICPGELDVCDTTAWGR